jgi:hypothetical protein
VAAVTLRGRGGRPGGARPGRQDVTPRDGHCEAAWGGLTGRTRSPLVPRSSETALRRRGVASLEGPRSPPNRSFPKEGAILPPARFARYRYRLWPPGVPPRTSSRLPAAADPVTATGRRAAGWRSGAGSGRCIRRVFTAVRAETITAGRAAGRRAKLLIGPIVPAVIAPASK